MEILRFALGDILKMRKKHPCGSSEMRVLRVGSDMRIVCTGCGRDLTLPREKLEKAVKSIRRADPANDTEAI
ncbi:MAG: DUF951 domain-containing protein [Clostridia bacterium]|nr:DUF951 domain-containing protein [Clostridia bacterium]